MGYNSMIYIINMANHVTKFKYPLEYGETEGTFISITATHTRISKIDLIESVEFHLQMHELCAQGHTLMLHTQCGYIPPHTAALKCSMPVNPLANRSPIHTHTHTDKVRQSEHSISAWTAFRTKRIYYALLSLSLSLSFSATTPSRSVCLLNSLIGVM